jgi:hypothetical protein
VEGRLRHTISFGDGEVKAMVEVCRLCGNGDGPIVLFGLSIIGITYPGEARFICADCIDRVEKWVNEK